MKNRAFVIMRAQPFHNGHKALIDFALTQAKVVWVVLGDTWAAPDFNNPWSVTARRDMIRATYKDDRRVQITGARDYPYNDRMWICEVVKSLGGLDPSKDVFVTHRKAGDPTSHYMDLFGCPTIFSDIVTICPWAHAMGVKEELSATTMRRRIGLGKVFDLDIYDMMPEMAFETITSGEQIDVIDQIQDEFDKVVLPFEDDWSCPATRKWGGPNQVAVDALVYSMAGEERHIALIQRGKGGGRGKWAMPGGFVDKNERLVQAACRELQEETGLIVNPAGYNSRHLLTFDDPRRSTRWRIVTHVLPIMFTRPMPMVWDGDEVLKAEWMPESEFHRRHREFYADHWHIIEEYFRDK